MRNSSGKDKVPRFEAKQPQQEIAHDRNARLFCIVVTSEYPEILLGMAKRKDRLQLKIVLDTNAIWSGGESYLLRREMAELVEANRGDSHLAIEWILPQTVLHERVYQMQKEAALLLPNLARLERVIGHPLNITEKLIDQRISEAVAQQVQGHQLLIHSPAYDRIDWLRFVEDAVNRRPPFEEKSEKGFRDALIAETFLQLVEDAPKQAQRCRIVLLTKDQLLTQAIKARLGGRENVQILQTADELKGLINTLISIVPEDYVVRLQTKAREYFFSDAKEEKGLVYDLKVRDAIRDRCEEQLAAKPEGSTRRSNELWELTPPRFVKKEGQRVFWASRFSIRAKAYKQLPTQSLFYESGLGGGVVLGQPAGLGTTFALGQPTSGPVSLGSLMKPSSNVALSSGIPLFGTGPVGPSGGLVNLSTLAGNEQLIATGATVIDVNWSVSVNIKGVFSKPKIESIEFVETTWENVV